MITLTPHSNILFQGDSITDTGRHKEDDRGTDREKMGSFLGKGYAMMTAARLLAENPQMNIKNLGISGNRIVDLYARAQEHIWNHQPDILSILIGVNDTWHHFKRQAGVNQARFDRCYRQLLSETTEACPDVQLVLCHPFVLPCGVVEDGWREDVDQRRQTIDQIAGDFDAIVVPFQDMFDEAVKRAPAEHWAPDGVHPSPAGHYLMAQRWQQSVLSTSSPS